MRCTEITSTSTSPDIASTAAGRERRLANELPLTGRGARLGAMDARRRLFALLVALLCAMGWVPTASARASGDSVVAGESRGVLPGRLPETPPAEPSTTGGDDEPADLPPGAMAVTPSPSASLETSGASPAERPAPRRVRPASPRGPPSIA
jgi:hypothetical protein